jgi:hypothetical protein
MYLDSDVQNSQNPVGDMQVRLGVQDVTRVTSENFFKGKPPHTQGTAPKKMYTNYFVESHLRRDFEHFYLFNGGYKSQTANGRCPCR